MNDERRPGPGPGSQRDPLESAWRGTLIFGSVFLLAFLVNLVRWLLGLRLAAPIRGDEPPGWAMAAGFLVFAFGTGASVATARRRARGCAGQNAISGVLVGGFYSGSCWFTFGRMSGGGLGMLVLVLGVWGGVAWAVASGLDEALSPPRR